MTEPLVYRRYNVTLKNVTRVFEVPKRYTIKRALGTGAYGMVVEAFDEEKKIPVAIKKNFEIFSKHKDDREYQKRILRELMILKHFSDKEGNENLITLLDLIYPKPLSDFDDVYLVMPLMRGDLRQIIRSKEIFSDDHVKFYLYHLLVGLKFMQSAGVLHRDLKPSNILVDENNDVKICDFGLSRGIDKNFDLAMSTYQVCTRWYRSPELLLMWDKNTHLEAFDMWSVGCIFAELLQRTARRPIFPGKHYLDQIECILKLTGTPDPDDIKGVEKALKYVKSLPKYDKKPFFKGMNEYPNKQAIDLLSKLLEFNPEKRITMEEALAHPYLEEIRDEEMECTCPPFTFRFSDQIKTEDIKKMIHDELVEWNKGVTGEYTVEGTTIDITA